MPDEPVSLALQGWTVKPTPKGWMIAPSSPSWRAPVDWEGPFPTLKHATLAIANALTREARRRIKRRAAAPAGE